MSASISDPLTFYYSEADVVAAQRSRFKSAPQVKIIFGFGFLVAVLLLIFEYTVGIPRAVQVEPWLAPAGIAGTFLGVLLLVYFVAPVIDFRFNPAWKNEFQFQFDPEFIYYTHSTAGTIFRVRWEHISRIVENKRVYVLFVGSPLTFLILPKSAFPSVSVESEFRTRLASSKHET